MSNSQSVKYRLIGALVIVFSFSLAWLLLLDHDVQRHQDWQSSMPKKVDVERFDIDKPVKSAPQEISGAASEASSKTQSQDRIEEVSSQQVKSVSLTSQQKIPQPTAVASSSQSEISPTTRQSP